MRALNLAIVCMLFVVVRCQSADSSTLNALLFENSLPPIGHTLFCQNYPGECAYRRPAPRFLSESSKALYYDLEQIHRRINTSIRPNPVKAGKLDPTERWNVSPISGNCNDFAVSKRHELLQRGWPSSALLLAEVTLDTGEHHLILVVNLHGDSYVLDNLEPNPVPLLQTTRYRWKRIESAEDPRLWLNMAPPVSVTKREAGLHLQSDRFK
jgi:predicted transglutaminase-like cysteine proteinase